MPTHTEHGFDITYGQINAPSGWRGTYQLAESGEEAFTGNRTAEIFSLPHPAEIAGKAAGIARAKAYRSAARTEWPKMIAQDEADSYERGVQSV
jgi:hypothetical protein